ncbi:MAG: (2Fe-2S)-binding protein [Planctomycetes bacterium]|nr:(2Fe-2S)-binding protein [Planctomycetota bacterium]
MAGAPANPLVNIKIDGKPYQFPKGTNLLMACLKAENPASDYPDQNTGGEHYVPHFCYHPGLSVSGNCRMCFVKTKVMVKRGDQMVPMEQITTSCTNTVSEGLEVFTKTDDVKKVRAGIMDLELINHPLDCPECDKAGECALQDYAFDHGHAASKFEFEKVKAHIKPLSDKITIWGTRCIQCSRCIRVADEISGTSELCFVNRGDHTVIDIFPGKPIENDLSLNTVEVCPVGALKNRDFLYTARVWNLDEMPGVCGLCAKGCATRVDSLRNEVTRVMARENPKVNDFWICDQARLDFKWINSPKRMDRPRTRAGMVSWDFGYDAAVESLRRAASEPAKAWALAHASMTNEEMFLFRRLVRQRLGISNIAVMAQPDKAPLNYPKFKSPADANANRIGAQIVLGVQNAEDSMRAFAEACGRGEVNHVLVWSGMPHGMEKLPEVTRALASESISNIVAVDFQSSTLTELAHVVLATTTHVETAGSWINHAMLLQAFRPALPYPREGRVGTEILQELLFRLGETAAELPDAGKTPLAALGADSYRREATQRGWEGSSTVPVFAGRGEVAVESRPRKLILSPAAVFDQMVAEVPQFAGHSHLSLIQHKGAQLL